MNSTSQSPRGHFLSLPRETRLQIYTYVYQSIDNRKSEALFFIRDDTSILQPMHRPFRHEGTAHLRVCRTVHPEAASILYEGVNFRITMYFGDGWPKYQYAGPIDSSNPLIRQMRHVEVNVHLDNEVHVNAAFWRLRRFANALQEAEAELKTCVVKFKAVTSYLMAVTGEMVAMKREEELECLVEEERLYREMLRGSQIVSVR